MKVLWPLIVVGLFVGAWIASRLSKREMPSQRVFRKMEHDRYLLAALSGDENAFSIFKRIQDRNAKYSIYEPAEMEKIRLEAVECCRRAIESKPRPVEEKKALIASIYEMFGIKQPQAQG